MSGADDGRFDDWVERARKTTCRGELERRGLWSVKMLGDSGVPCPGCGGRDRFAVHVRKDIFICRKAGVGGDAIAMVRHLDECSFLVAVEVLTGERPPDRAEAEKEDERAARIQRIEARNRAQVETAEKQAAEAQKYRGYEREAAHRLWLNGHPIAGTMAERYLALRSLLAPSEARLRFHPQVPYFSGSIEYDTRYARARRIYEGPALLGAIQDAAGMFIGVHRTWIDLDTENGKAEIVDPNTGELLPAKKARGSKRGGSIRLAGHPKDVMAPRPARRVIMGEGIETTLSAYAVMTKAERAETEFCAAVDLGNMAGKAAGRVPHPSESKPVRGRQRRVFVQDDVPDPRDDTPIIGLPDGVTEIILLGDGDSEAVRTGLALRRAAVRFAEAYRGATVRLAMARAGCDFNTMLRAA